MKNKINIIITTYNYSDKTLEWIIYYWFLNKKSKYDSRMSNRLLKLEK